MNFYNFRTIDRYHSSNGTLYRDLWKIYGMKIIVTITGEGRTFDFITTMIAIGSGVGLFGVATLVSDLILRLFVKDKTLLNHKYDKVLLDNEFQKCYYNSDNNLKSKNNINDNESVIDLSDSLTVANTNRNSIVKNNINIPVVRKSIIETSPSILCEEKIKEEEMEEKRIVIKIEILFNNLLLYLNEIYKSILKKEEVIEEEMNDMKLSEKIFYTIKKLKAKIQESLYDNEEKLKITINGINSNSNNNINSKLKNKLNRSIEWEIIGSFYESENELNDIIIILQNEDNPYYNEEIITDLLVVKSQIKKIVKYIKRKYNL